MVLVYCSFKRVLSFRLYLRRLMSSHHPKRFFINRCSDSDTEQHNKRYWVEKIRETVNLIAKKQSTSSRSCDGGLYVGVGGVAYMFYNLAKRSNFSTDREKYLEQAVLFISHGFKYCEESRQPEDKAAFLLGSAGIYAVAAVIARAIGRNDDIDKALQRFVQGADVCKNIDFLSFGGDELLVGRAGYLCGALWLQQELGFQPVPQAKLVEIWKTVVESGRRYARQKRSPAALMYQYHGTEYLGAAHGVSGILQMLLSFPDILRANPADESDIHHTVDFYLRLQKPNGNFPCAMDEIHDGRRSENDELVHWCHGAPGAIYMFAKAYLTWHDGKYLDACVRCGDVVWNKGLLRKGPGICHGIAGNGYVFLLLYRLTQDKKYLNRALKFGEFMFGDEFHSARTPDSPYSLYEGLSGTVCFLADLLEPENSAFPFFDVMR